MFKVPCYIIHGTKVREQFSKLRSALPPEVIIYYSLKANSHKQVVGLLRELGAHADVASLKELETALSEGFPSSMIEFTGPGKSEHVLEKAVDLSVSPIVVESLEELKRIESIGKEQKKIVSISLRINPLEWCNPAGRVHTQSSSQFGLDEESLHDFTYELKKCKQVNLIGLHIYTQSQILDIEVLKKNFSLAFKSVKNVSEQFEHPLKLVNLGGGFGVPYWPDSTELDLSSLKEYFSSILQEMKELPALKAASLCVESGRFLVSPAGQYLARVEYIKHSRGKKIAVLNGGFSQNMAACGFGQLIRKNYHIRLHEGTSTGNKEVYTLAGPSCYSLDVLATDVVLPELKARDVISFENCGSYGASFSPSQFLGFEPAHEYFLEDK